MRSWKRAAAPLSIGAITALAVGIAAPQALADDLPTNTDNLIVLVAGSASGDKASLEELLTKAEQLEVPVIEVSPSGKRTGAEIPEPTDTPTETETDTPSTTEESPEPEASEDDSSSGSDGGDSGGNSEESDSSTPGTTRPVADAGSDSEETSTPSSSTPAPPSEDEEEAPEDTGPKKGVNQFDPRALPANATVRQRADAELAGFLGVNRESADTTYVDTIYVRSFAPGQVALVDSARINPSGPRAEVRKAIEAEKFGWKKDGVGTRLEAFSRDANVKRLSDRRSLVLTTVDSKPTGAWMVPASMGDVSKPPETKMVDVSGTGGYESSCEGAGPDGKPKTEKPNSYCALASTGWKKASDWLTWVNGAIRDGVKSSYGQDRFFSVSTRLSENKPLSYPNNRPEGRAYMMVSWELTPENREIIENYGVQYAALKNAGAGGKPGVTDKLGIKPQEWAGFYVANNGTRLYGFRESDYNGSCDQNPKSHSYKGVACNRAWDDYRDALVAYAAGYQPARGSTDKERDEKKINEDGADGFIARMVGHSHGYNSDKDARVQKFREEMVWSVSAKGEVKQGDIQAKWLGDQGITELGAWSQGSRDRAVSQSERDQGVSVNSGAATLASDRNLDRFLSGVESVPNEVLMNNYLRLNLADDPETNPGDNASAPECLVEWARPGGDRGAEECQKLGAPAKFPVYNYDGTKSPESTEVPPGLYHGLRGEKWRVSTDDRGLTVGAAATRERLAWYLASKRNAWVPDQPLAEKIGLREIQPTVDRGAAYEAFKTSLKDVPDQELMRAKELVSTMGYADISNKEATKPFVLLSPRGEIVGFRNIKVADAERDDWSGALDASGYADGASLGRNAWTKRVDKLLQERRESGVPEGTSLPTPGSTPSVAPASHSGVPGIISGSDSRTGEQFGIRLAGGPPTILAAPSESSGAPDAPAGDSVFEGKNKEASTPEEVSKAIAKMQPTIEEILTSAPEGTRFFLAGQEAGAGALGNAVTRIGNGELPGVESSSIAGTTLVSDPLRRGTAPLDENSVVPGVDKNLGGNTPGTGILGTRASDFGELQDNTVQICANGDATCANSGMLISLASALVDGDPNKALPAATMALEAIPDVLKMVQAVDPSTVTGIATNGATFGAAVASGNVPTALVSGGTIAADLFDIAGAIVEIYESSENLPQVNEALALIDPETEIGAKIWAKVPPEAATPEVKSVFSVIAKIGRSLNSIDKQRVLALGKTVALGVAQMNPLVIPQVAVEIIQVMGQVVQAFLNPGVELSQVSDGLTTLNVDSPGGTSSTSALTNLVSATEGATTELGNMSTTGGATDSPDSSSSPDMGDAGSPTGVGAGENAGTGLRASSGVSGAPDYSTAELPGKSGATADQFPADWLESLAS